MSELKLKAVSYNDGQTGIRPGPDGMWSGADSYEFTIESNALPDGWRSGNIRIVDNNRDGIIEPYEITVVYEKGKGLTLSDYKTIRGNEAFSLYGNGVQTLVNRFRSDLPMQLLTATSKIRIDDLQTDYFYCDLSVYRKPATPPSAQLCATRKEGKTASEGKVFIDDYDNDGKADSAALRLPSGVWLHMEGVLYAPFGIGSPNFDSHEEPLNFPHYEGRGITLYPQSEPTRAGLAIYLSGFDDLLK